MKADVPFQDFPAYTERSSKSPTLVIVFFLVLFLVIATAGGLYYLNSQSKQMPVISLSPTSEPTIPATPTSSPSATPALERSNLQLAVLNGSGRAGAARGVSSHLTQAGYKITVVGNADGFVYRNITVKIKKTRQSYLQMLTNDFQDAPGVSSVSASIDDTIRTDAEVIVGR